MIEKINQNKIGKMIQTSSDHEIADVKAKHCPWKGTEKNNVLRNKIRMKKEIDATYNSPISCLKLRFLATSLMIYLLFIH